jgi:hypothetical protein
MMGHRCGPTDRLPCLPDGAWQGRAVQCCPHAILRCAMAHRLIMTAHRSRLLVSLTVVSPYISYVPCGRRVRVDEEREAAAAERWAAEMERKRRAEELKRRKLLAKRARHQAREEARDRAAEL